MRERDTHKATEVLDLATQIFDYLCSQYHQCVVGDLALPTCQRCTGLYVGATIAGLLVLLCRPRSTALFLWSHGLMLLLMVPFGYHLFPQTGSVRILTGQLFGIGLVAYLALVPMSRVFAGQPAGRAASWTYVVGVLASLAMLPLAVRSQNPWAAVVLVWLGLLGLLLLTGLVVINLVLLPSEFLRLVRRPRTSKTP